MIAPATKRWLGPGITAGVCAGLLVVFAILSYTASLTKSATYDEPLHVMGAYVHRYHYDFRINPEDPALFGRIIALAQPAGALKLDLTSRSFAVILEDIGLQWPYIWTTMYHTPGNDEQKLLRRSRAVTVSIGVVLGGLIAWWSYLLGGPVAAIAAGALFAFDPNFLAHSGIVKNDVPLSCVLTGLMFAVWLSGRRATWIRLSAVALLCGAAVSIKYSGVLAGPFVAIALLIRALLPQPWTVVGQVLSTRWNRLLAATTACIVFLIVSWAMVWAAYGFRFSPTPRQDARFNMSNLERLARIKELSVPKLRQSIEAEKRGQTLDLAATMITQQEIEQHTPARIVRVILFANEHELLPQGWLAGFLYTYATTLVRSTYLNGVVQQLGWWYFFPLAMLYKTPLASLIAAGAALLVMVVGKIAYRGRNFRVLDWWSFSALLIAPVLYGASAVNANLNLGLRHVLPVYPFIFIAIGVTLALIMARWRVVGSTAAVLLGLALIVESVAAYPNFIPFFNAAAGGARGGFKLLGDSNLDWGQDLKLLARWQQAHPDKRLLISYFGIADPEYYGVKALHLPGGYVFAQPQVPDPRYDAVLAVSATNLQGIYLPPDLRASYAELLKREPLEVLGGSIYLYYIPAAQPAR